MKHTKAPWVARACGAAGIENEIFVYCTKGYIICGPISKRPDGDNNALLIESALTKSQEQFDRMNQLVQAYEKLLKG